MEYLKQAIMVTTVKTSKWERPVLTLILAMIHKLIDVLTQVWLLVNVFVRKFSSRNNSIKSEFRSLQGLTKSHLTKIPSHVAFAFLETSISLHDVSKLIIWSVASGAQGISLYDIPGFLKHHQDELKDQVIKLTKQFGQDSKFFQFQWNGQANDQNEKVVINILSKEDGQDDIVQAARKLAQSVQKGSMKPEDVNETLLEANLSSSRGLPDPEVLLRFGLAHSNQGYPPWQLRLSEIHDIDTHHGVSISDFSQVLMKYSKCQQRFGR